MYTGVYNNHSLMKVDTIAARPNCIEFFAIIYVIEPVVRSGKLLENPIQTPLRKRTDTARKEELSSNRWKKVNISELCDHFAVQTIVQSTLEPYNY